jgi:hypothetical protein
VDCFWRFQICVYVLRFVTGDALFASSVSVPTPATFRFASSFFVSFTGAWFFYFATVVLFPMLVSLLCWLVSLLFVVKAAVPLEVVVGDGGVRLVTPLLSDLCVVELRHVFMVVLCSGGFWSKLLWRVLVSRRKAMLISLSALQL